MKWMVYFFSAFSLAFLISFFLIKLKEKSSGEKALKIQRLGGVGVIISFLIVFFLSEIHIEGKLFFLIILGLAILFFGVWDDFRNLSWKKQLLFQFFLIGIAISLGFSVEFISLSDNFLWRFDVFSWNFFGQMVFPMSIFFVFVWMSFLVNAINWADGMDGLAIIIGIIGAISILFVSLRPEVNQPAVAILSVIFIGGLLGFGWFNFPPAMIIAGTSGSYFIGFFLASLAIMAGTKIATLMIVLALPMADAIWVIFSRIRAGRSIFSRDEKCRHFHYQLQKIGWSDKKILVSYFVFIGAMAFLGIFFSGGALKAGLLALETFLVFSAIFIVNQQVQMKNGK